MTVKCVNQLHQDAIVKFYNRGNWPIVGLASRFCTSPRTIGRILEERGLATPAPRLKGEAYNIMQLLKKHNLSYDGLENMILNFAILQKYKPKQKK